VILAPGKYCSALVGANIETQHALSETLRLREGYDFEVAG
jgi:hypothetical protein